MLGKDEVPGSIPGVGSEADFQVWETSSVARVLTEGPGTALGHTITVMTLACGLCVRNRSGRQARSRRGRCAAAVAARRRILATTDVQVALGRPAADDVPRGNLVSRSFEAATRNKPRPIRSMISAPRGHRLRTRRRGLHSVGDQEPRSSFRASCTRRAGSEIWARGSAGDGRFARRVRPPRV